MNDKFFWVIWYNVTSVTGDLFTRTMFQFLSNQRRGVNYFIRTIFCGWTVFDSLNCVALFTTKT